MDASIQFELDRDEVCNLVLSPLSQLTTSFPLLTMWILEWNAPNSICSCVDHAVYPTSFLPNKYVSCAAPCCCHVAYLLICSNSFPSSLLQLLIAIQSLTPTRWASLSLRPNAMDTILPYRAGRKMPVLPGCQRRNKRQSNIQGDGGHVFRSPASNSPAQGNQSSS
jgi:hypothetical protein